MRGNEGDAPAPNPPLFGRYPLREEQRRSLAWMLQQERRPSGLKGGLLADEMGYGKTSTLIGLLSLDPCVRGEAPPAASRAGETGYLRSNSSLVIVPPHLFEQWKDELRKFLGDDVVEMWEPCGGQPTRTRKVSGEGPIKILLMENAGDTAYCRLGDLLVGYGIVLISTRVFQSQYYAEKVNAVLTAFEQEHYRKSANVKIQMLRKVVDAWKRNPQLLARAKKDTPPVFEVVWWRRVVLDEFHQSVGWGFAVKERVKGTGSTFRWGLSGTPPLVHIQQVASMCMMLQYERKEASARFRKAVEPLVSKPWIRPAWRGWLESNALTETVERECRAFLDKCVRQNTSAIVGAICCTEHQELIALTPEEKLIYRQACHDQDIFDLASGYDAVGLQARASLLQRCAHFVLDGGEARDSWDAVQQLGSSKTARIEALEAQLKLEVARSQIFDAWNMAKPVLRRACEGLRHRDAKAIVAAVLSTERSGCQADDALKLSLGHSDVHPEVRFVQPVRDAEVYCDSGKRHAILHAAARHLGHREADKALKALAVCRATCDDHARQHLKEALVRGLELVASMLDQACASRDFFKAQLAALSRDGLADFQCAVCLESSGASLANLCIIPCGHIFHGSCLRQWLSTRADCPYCGQHVKKQQASSVIMELQPPSRPEVASPQLCAHGTKLNALAVRLKAIRAGDSQAKVIVFMQWTLLQTRVASALQSHGIEAVCLLKSRSAGEALRSFQESSSGPWVILLSLDEVASGSNLTAANHVVFLHPMNAQDMATAVAYEKQAVGRVRRIGQQKDVHIWRFVAKETVEEHIHSLHRGQVEAAHGQG